MTRASSTVGLLALVSVLAALASTSTMASAQQASLLGTVMADSTEQPLANAEIVIVALNIAARTDSAGNFALTRLPAGSYQVVIRALGRVPHRETVTFGATDRIERDFLLRRAVNTLETVDVNAAPEPVEMRLAEFQSRRKLGFGKFLTQNELAKAEGRKLADVLRSRIAGLRPAATGGSDAMMSTRGVISVTKLPSGDRSDRMRGATPQCYVQVIVDGMIRYRSQPGEKLFDINSIAPDQLSGVEYYTAATTPLQYNSTGVPCGTLLLWTRMR